jgi:hypothetical protein
MLALILGIFFVLHGLVHLLYAGQSWRLFELRPNMTWPDGAWLLSRIFSTSTLRLLASFSLALAALGFIAGGIGTFLSQVWWQPLALGAAVLSSLIFLLLWDGRLKALDDQGGIGVLINLAIWVAVLILK